MNRQKIVQKLKRRRTWPHIVGLIVFAILFSITITTVFAMVYYNMLGTKILDGYKDAQIVSITMTEKTTDSVIKRDIYNIQRAIPQVKAVCFVDKDNNIIKQIGTDKPDFSLEGTFMFAGQELILLPGEGTKAFTADLDGELSLDLSEIVGQRTLKKILLNIGEKGYKKADNVWENFNIWYALSCDEEGDKVYVYRTIEITNFEAYCMIALFIIVSMVGILLMVYFVVEFIKIITDQRRAFRIIHTDLTTLGNNRTFFKDFGTRLLRHRRKKPYAVVHLRLEKYRHYCMYHGENQGEDLLEQIYKVLKKFISKKEILAHIEGADFAMLLISENEVKTTERVEAMLEALEHVATDSKLHYSVGITSVSESNDTIMYYNEAGVARGTLDEDSEKRIAWFNENLKAAKIWEQRVENDMERALANKEFQVYLQPKYSTEEEVLSGAEALVRWIHPTEGFVAPYKFIPIFEKNGFITKLDDYMISETARIQSEWYKAGKKIVPVSVNVSRVHFLMNNLADHIAALVDCYELPHEYIELELTESAFFDDKEALLKTVNEMKHLGFHVSMDDFGSGYSSLNSLKELPLDVIKLDAEFFRGTDDYDRANLIVSKTIDLAKRLGMSIVAEGIETREQVDFLKEQKCDLIQGYYFAKPMPVEEFEKKAFSNP